MSFAAAQATYVLHSRPYKETSALVDFFTPLGRLRAVLRGARGKAGALARPFVPLEAEWRGRGELKTVARLESAGIPNLLNGQALFSGLYLNELLIRLLPAEDPQPEIFAHYAATLPLLAAGRPIEPLLRAFEWRLLEQLGYGFALDVDIDGRPIEPQALYQLCQRPAWSRWRSCNPGCSRAPNCYPWPTPTGAPRRPGGGQAPDAPGARSPSGRPAAGQPRAVHEP
ncbi:DNA repair protein RecO [Pseudomonas aeruginosa]